MILRPTFGTMLGYPRWLGRRTRRRRSPGNSQPTPRPFDTRSCTAWTHTMQRGIGFLLTADLCTFMSSTRKLIFLNLSSHQCVHFSLSYTYANHITCRLLPAIIYIHIHEQCYLPLATWLLLNLICIILRN